MFKNKQVENLTEKHKQTSKL